MKLMFNKLSNSPTFTTWGSILARLGGNLIILFVVLVNFTVEEILIWQYFVSINVLILLLDFGASPTFSRLISLTRGGMDIRSFIYVKSAAKFDEVDFSRRMLIVSDIFALQRWLIPRLSLCIILLVSVFGTIILIKPISAAPNYSEAWIAWLIVIISCPYILSTAAYSACLQGLDEIPRLRRWEIATGLMTIPTTLLIITFGGGLFEVVVNQQFWIVFGALRNKRIIRKFSPNLFLTKPKRNTELLNIAFPQVWRSGVGILSSHGLIQLSGLLYGQIASPEMATTYLIAIRFMSIVSQFSQSPFYSRIPILTKLYAEGKKNDLLFIASKSMRESHLTFFFGVSIVGISGELFLEHIGANVSFIDERTWFLFSLAYFFERIGAMHLQFYSIVGDIQWHIANGVSAMLTIICFLMIFKHIELAAFPVAFLIVNTFWFAPYCLSKSRKEFQFSVLVFESKVSFPVAVSMMVFELLF